MIEVRQARYFIAVAEELHFGRAAERLRMSQPPLSQAIRHLERQLGARLLERTSRAVALTEPGRVFLGHCYTLVAAAERAGVAAELAQAGYLGTLAIGAVTSAFSEPLPAILSRFHAGRPDIDLRVREVDTMEGVRALLDRHLDIAVIRHGADDERLRSDPLRRDRLVAAVPEGHELAAEGVVDLGVLADQPWVWIPRSISPTYHDELVIACRRAGFSPEPRHQAKSIHSQLAMIGCGLGVGLVPHTSASAPARGVAYLSLREPVFLVELAVVRRATDTEPLVEHFVSCALMQAG
ncbi:LysR family transcriptional regulator [Spongiactinospora sp. 9N601]|uniref:LysR family transcriptional regulator n=1 Tax=Spongiactinospora sp. 9N601 TaxID=3375149 RepID=UPI0037AF39D5